MLARFSSVWTLVSLSAFVVVSQCLAAPTTQRENDGDAAADAAAAAVNPPLVRIKRADEVIFNAQSNEASLVKKSDDAAMKEDTARIHDDETKGDDVKKPVSGAEETAAAPDNMKTETEDEAQSDDHETSDDKQSKHSEQQDDVVSVDAVATSSDDSEKRDAAADGDSRDSSLMLAENMEAQQSEQKLRAKRDLDADEIRELFQSQNVPVDDYSAPDYTYDDVGFYDDVEPYTEDDLYDEGAARSWQNDDYYDDFEGRPKRGDEEQYQNDVEREEVRELLAEQAAEEARQALMAFLTSGEPTYSVDEPLVDPEDLALEEEEYNELMNDEEEAQPDLYNEEPEMTEKRFYPYSYEPYGGRWGALVPGAKRGDRDPYDRLYRLAEVLSRPAQLGSDVDDYEKK